MLIRASLNRIHFSDGEVCFKDRQGIQSYFNSLLVKQSDAKTTTKLLKVF